MEPNNGQTIIPQDAMGPGSPKVTTQNVAFLVAAAKWLAPFVLGTAVTSGSIFGFDLDGAKEQTTLAAVRAEQLATCQRDKEFWRDRAVAAGGGID